MVKMNWLEKWFVNSRLNNFWHRKFGVVKLLKWARIPPPRRILELGCGMGYTSTQIAKRYPAAKIVATDVDPEQIALAKKGTIRNLTFAVADAKKTSYKSGAFDTAFQLLAFHHIPGYTKAIQEVHRLLKKSGRFVVMELQIPFHGTCTKKQFIRALKKSGFVIKKRKGFILYSLVAVKKA